MSLDEEIKVLKNKLKKAEAANARLRAIIGMELKLSSMPESGIPEDGDTNWPITTLRKAT